MKATRRRRGLSFLELVMVITLMGILAAIGTARFGRSALANFGAEGEARKVSLSMLRAQRAAIKTGENHFLQFDSAAPTSATQFRLMRRTGAGTSLVEGPFVFSTDVTIVPSTLEMDFNFEGEAAAAYQVTFNGKGRRWQLTVVPITGAVAVAEITP